LDTLSCGGSLLLDAHADDLHAPEEGDIDEQERRWGDTREHREIEHEQIGRYQRDAELIKGRRRNGRAEMEGGAWGGRLCTADGV